MSLSSGSNSPRRVSCLTV